MRETSLQVKRFYERRSSAWKNIGGEREARDEPLTLSDSEDGGSAVGAYAFYCSLSVLERDVRWVLDLDVCFAFDTVCLWHSHSAERALERGSI